VVARLAPTAAAAGALVVATDAGTRAPLANAYRSGNAALCQYYLTLVGDAAEAAAAAAQQQQGSAPASAEPTPVAAPRRLPPLTRLPRPSGASARHRVAFLSLRLALTQPWPEPGSSVLHGEDAHFALTGPARSYAADCSYAALDVVLAAAFGATLRDVAESELVQQMVFEKLFTNFLLPRSPRHHQQGGGQSDQQAPPLQPDDWYLRVLPNVLSSPAPPAIVDFLMLFLHPTHLIGRLPLWSGIVSRLCKTGGAWSVNLTRVPPHPTLPPERALHAAHHFATAVSAEADARACADADAGRTGAALVLPPDAGVGPLPHHTMAPGAALRAWQWYLRTTATPLGSLAPEPVLTCFPRLALPPAPAAAAAVPVGDQASAPPMGTPRTHARTVARAKAASGSNPISSYDAWQLSFPASLAAAGASSAPLCPVCLRYTEPEEEQRSAAGGASAPGSPVARTGDTAGAGTGSGAGNANTAGGGCEGSYSARVFASTTPARCQPYCESTRLPDDVRLAGLVQRILALAPTRAFQHALLRPATPLDSSHVRLAARLNRPNLLWVLLQAEEPTAALREAQQALADVSAAAVSTDSDLDRSAGVGAPALGARHAALVVTSKLLKAAVPAKAWRDHLFPNGGDSISALFFFVAMAADCLPLVRFTLLEAVTVLAGNGLSSARSDAWVQLLTSALHDACGTTYAGANALRRFPLMPFSAVGTFLLDSIRCTDGGGGRGQERLAQLCARALATLPPMRAGDPQALAHPWPRTLAVCLAGVRAGGALATLHAGAPLTVLHALLLWPPEVDDRSDASDPGQPVPWRAYVTALLVAVREAAPVRVRNEALRQGKCPGRSVGGGLPRGSLAVMTRPLDASKKDVAQLSWQGAAVNDVSTSSSPHCCTIA
jgi:hypothetical protein